MRFWITQITPLHQRSTTSVIHPEERFLFLWRNADLLHVCSTTSASTAGTFYIYQQGYLFRAVYLSVCLWTGLHQHHHQHFYETWWKATSWVKEYVKLWSGSNSWGVLKLCWSFSPSISKWMSELFEWPSNFKYAMENFEYFNKAVLLNLKIRFTTIILNPTLMTWTVDAHKQHEIHPAAKWEFEWNY